MSLFLMSLWLCCNIFQLEAFARPDSWQDLKTRQVEHPPNRLAGQPPPSLVGTNITLWEERIDSSGADLYPYCQFDIRPSQDPDDPDDPGFHGVPSVAKEDEEFWFDCQLDPLPVSIDGTCDLQGFGVELEAFVWGKRVGDWVGNTKKGFDVVYDWAVIRMEIEIYEPKDVTERQIWIYGRFDWKVGKTKKFSIRKQLYPFKSPTTTKPGLPWRTPFPDLSLVA